MGQPHFCREGGINNTLGIHRNGGWAQYALVPAKQIHRLPEKVTLKQGILVTSVNSAFLVTTFSCPLRANLLPYPQLRPHRTNRYRQQNFNSRGRNYRQFIRSLFTPSGP